MAQQPADPIPPAPVDPLPPQPPPGATQPADPPPPTPQDPPPAPTPPVDPWPGMEAGGVKPPPPLPTTTAPSAAAASTTPEPPQEDVNAELDAAKEKDSGRGLDWFWFEVQGGYEHIGLQTFNIDEQNFSVGLVETESNGGVMSAGIGAQIVFLTLGARARLSFFEEWQMGRVGGELGFRIPIGIVEPRFDLGAGYAAVANFDSLIPEDISIHGFYVRAGAGVDFYPHHIISLGAHASFDFMGLTRPGLDPAQIQEIQQDPDIGDLPAAREQLLALEGSGYGASFALQGSVGLHF
ncbi:MAG: hypothetical protein IPG04_13025 [Polyangiaceae bacterium]|nr:hypothetical protein [Polyangiaceae bacterium]